MSTAAPDTPLTADEHRRVLIHLSHPRSLASLVRAVDADQGAPSLGIASLDRVHTLLDSCVEQGWAKNVGAITKARDLYRVPNSDPDVIDIPDEQAELIHQRARAFHARGRYLDDGDKFILTRTGLDYLTGPVPDEPPPLTGAPLRAALEHNVRLAEEAVERERTAEGRTPEQMEAALDVLARQQAALDEFLSMYGDDPDDEDDADLGGDPIG